MQFLLLLVQIMAWVLVRIVNLTIKIGWVILLKFLINCRFVVSYLLSSRQKPSWVLRGVILIFLAMVFVTPVLSCLKRPDPERQLNPKRNEPLLLDLEKLLDIGGTLGQERRKPKQKEELPQRKKRSMEQFKIYKFGGDICCEAYENQAKFVSADFEKTIDHTYDCEPVTNLQEYCCSVENETNCIKADINQITGFKYGLEHVVFVKRRIADFILWILLILSVLTLVFCLTNLVGLLNLIWICSNCLCYLTKPFKKNTAILVAIGLFCVAMGQVQITEEEAYTELEEANGPILDSYEIDNNSLIYYTPVQRTLKTATISKKFGKFYVGAIYVRGDRWANASFIMPATSGCAINNDTKTSMIRVSMFSGPATFVDCKSINRYNYVPLMLDKPNGKKCELLKVFQNFDLGTFEIRELSNDQIIAEKLPLKCAKYLWYDVTCKKWLMLTCTIPKTELDPKIIIGGVAHEFRMTHSAEFSDYTTLLVPQGGKVWFFSKEGASINLRDSGLDYLDGIWGDSENRGHFLVKKHFFYKPRSSGCLTDGGHFVEDSSIQAREMQCRVGPIDALVFYSETTCVNKLGFINQLRYFFCINNIFVIITMSTFLCGFILWLLLGLVRQVIVILCCCRKFREETKSLTRLKKKIFLLYCYSN